MLLIAKPILVAPRLSNKIHNIFQKMSMLRSDKSLKHIICNGRGFLNLFMFFLL